MAITAKQVKELREMTGAGMMDCKKALTATDGDFDKAIEFLREKGLATAEKKSGKNCCRGYRKSSRFRRRTQSRCCRSKCRDRLRG